MLRSLLALAALLGLAARSDAEVMCTVPDVLHGSLYLEDGDVASAGDQLRGGSVLELKCDTGYIFGGGVNFTICVQQNRWLPPAKACQASYDGTSGSCRNAFKCDNGKCLPKEFKCDGDNDCGDGSDEAGCGQGFGGLCGDGEFECSNENCIPAFFECDGVNDCGDSSDELHCISGSRHNCGHGLFACQNGHCIPNAKKCDLSNDCGDFSDELNCFANYAYYTGDEICQGFQCREGECINGSRACDNGLDCFDGSDELNCGSGLSSACLGYTCANGDCIRNVFVCDGEDDCGDNSDENDCDGSDAQNQDAGGDGGVGPQGQRQGNANDQADVETQGNANAQVDAEPQGDANDQADPDTQGNSQDNANDQANSNNQVDGDGLGNGHGEGNAFGVVDDDVQHNPISFGFNDGQGNAFGPDMLPDDLNLDGGFDNFPTNFMDVDPFGGGIVPGGGMDFGDFYQPGVPGDTPLITDPAAMPSLNPSQSHNKKCGASELQRIYGGPVAGKGEFPWLAKLFVKFRGSTDLVECGGALVSESWVMTAAHCVTDDDNGNTVQYVKVLLGRYDLSDSEETGVVIKSTQIYVHPYYSTDNLLDYDFALVKLSSFADINTRIQAVCLPENLCESGNVSASASNVDSCGNVVVAGWGQEKIKDSPDITLVAELAVNPRQRCDEVLPETTTNRQLCVGDGSPSSCQGDSGGPLLCKSGGQMHVIGLVSQCGIQSKPSIYSRVCAVMPWIHQTMGR